MESLRETAAAMEWANYAQVAYFARAVPGVEVRISSEAVQVTGPHLPTTEANHVALIQAEPERADELIGEITAHYRDLDLQPCVALSPACAPKNLDRRLEAQGYQKYGGAEYWLKLVDPRYVESIQYPPGVVVRRIGRDELPVFCRLMAAVFEMPEEMVPALEYGLTFTSELPGVNNYIAYANGEPAGCISMNTYHGYSAVGSGGVLPGVRRLGVSYALWKRTYEDWKKTGGDYVIQTVLPMLARVLCMGGCQQLFTRTYYVLP